MRFFTVLIALCLSVVSFASETPCLDPLACNFMEEGECFFTDENGDPCVTEGCTDDEACNFNPDANIDDGSCIPCAHPSVPCDFNPDFDEDGAYTVVDLLALLGAYGQSDLDLDGILDNVDPCVGAYDACGICNGDGEDLDEDGICDLIDLCIGEYDSCGICNGSGPDSLGIESISITYDSVFVEQLQEWYVYVLDTDTIYGMFCSEYGGCTDEDALNYNPNAQSDSLCQYSNLGEYEFTGTPMYLSVPEGLNVLQVELKGASGGGVNGGSGSIVSGPIEAFPLEVLQVNVGGQGGCPNAGYNGGGEGGNAGGANAGCGGGGASDIRRYPFGLQDRIFVAAGGGGMGGGNTYSDGGGGGCNSGENGDSPFGQGGSGGTQSSGGSGGPPWINAGNAGGNGELGVGGVGAIDPCYNVGPGGGGGGGYFGGGGGGSDCFSAGTLGGGAGGGGASLTPVGAICTGSGHWGDGVVSINIPGEWTGSDTAEFVFECDYFLDQNLDGIIGTADLLAFLALFGEEDSDGDGIFDSQDDCFGVEDDCGVCNGDGVDQDADGICDDVDSCVGYFDECGICDGPGPSIPVIDSLIYATDSLFIEAIQEWYVFDYVADTVWTLQCDFSTCGESLTYHGYHYETVLIGEQCWFAENLRNEHYANGDSIPGGLINSEWSSTTEGAQSIYNNDESNLADYGRLYNWYAVDDARGLCPIDWHVPTDGEFMTLEMELGMSESEANGTGHRGSNQGFQLKTTYGWYAGGNGTNSSGFSGLPGGLQNLDGDFYYAGNIGYWWSSSLSGSAAWDRQLFYDYPTVYRSYPDPIRNGLSVRCVRD